MGQQLNELLRPATCTNGQVGDISESVADDDTTWVGVHVPNNSQTGQQLFTIGFNMPNFPKDGVESIQSFNITARARVSVADFSSASITNGGIRLKQGKKNILTSPADPAKNLTSNYQNFIFSPNSNFLTKLPQEINNRLANLAKLKFEIDLTVKGTSNPYKWSSAFDLRITQVFAEIVYTAKGGITKKDTIFIKENGQWIEYPSAYKKQAGNWVKIEPVDLFKGLQNGDSIPAKKG